MIRSLACIQMIVIVTTMSSDFEDPRSQSNLVAVDLTAIRLETLPSLLRPNARYSHRVVGSKRSPNTLVGAVYEICCSHSRGYGPMGAEV